MTNTTGGYTAPVIIPSAAVLEGLSDDQVAAQVKVTGAKPSGTRAGDLMILTELRGEPAADLVVTQPAADPVPAATGALEGADEPDPIRPHDLLQDFMYDIEEPLTAKIKEFASHTYTSAVEELSALAEAVKTLAKEAGYEIHDIVAHAAAAAALLEHKVQGGVHVITAPKPPAAAA